MGAHDPRLNSAHEIDFHLQQTLCAWKHTDPEPLCVKPIPIPVIRRIAVSATLDLADNTFRAAVDMIIIAFFFLLCPGEYTDINNDPFHLADMQLFIGDTRLQLLTALASELCLARFASLMFTSQKNGVHGKMIGLTCSGDPSLCPVQAIIQCVLYLHLHMAPPQHPWHMCSTPPTRSPHPSSPHVFASWSPCWALTLASFLPRFRPIVFAQLARPPFF
jgi:hypothetical protein